MAEPRAGQWMKFHVNEPLASRMREAGCFETPDGFFLSIFRKGYERVTRHLEEGTVIVEKIPSALMVVNRKGDNVPVLQDGEMRNLCFPLDKVENLCPMIQKEHFPPEYIGKTDVDPLP